MEILFKIIGLSLLTTFSVLILKQNKPDLAMLLGVAGGVLVFLCVVDLLKEVFGLFEKVMEITHLNSDLFALLVKIVGIGYITEFGANICSDSGNSALASKILLAGKLVIFVMSIPIITSLVELIASIMP